MRRKAFTLIELLVVISIIAVLIGIIVPALGRAKEVARRVVCGAHQKGLGTGIYVSANNSNGTLPEGQYEIGLPVGGGTGKGGVPVYAYIIFQLQGTPAQQEQQRPKERVAKAWGLGKLFMDDIVEEGEAFYCPGIPKAVNDQQHFAYEYYSNNGTTFPFNNERASVKGNRTRSSFMYVPQSARKKMKVDSGNQYFPATAKKVSELDSSHVLACDVLFALDWLPHKKGKKGAGVNVLWSDGSVSFTNDSKAFTTDLWGTPRDPKNLSGDEVTFRTIIDALE